MDGNHLPPTSTGKLISAFIAGTLIGALAIVEVLPGNVASTAAAPMASTGGEFLTEGGEVAPDDAGFGSGSDTSVAGVGSVSSTSGTSTGGGSTTGSASTSGAGSGPGPAGTSSSTGGGTGGSDPSGGTSGSTSTGADSTTGSGGSGGSSGTSGSGTSGVDIGGSSGSGSGSGSGTSSGGAGGAGCAANNGGATDVGVTATEIQVAATTVEGGAGASLLRPARTGMDAVLNEVNRSGGICGRRIVLETRNDNWDPATGSSYIRNFIEAGKFALLVVPSSEGLAEAIQSGMISQAGIPVVGTTGLRIQEYKEPWVWPVSTATISIMRVMAKHAYDNGAREFGIVWDSKFKFGVEGRDAFRKYIGTLPGATIRADTALDPDQQSYSTQAQSFNQQCASKCDMVALLLVPDTALKWKNANSGEGAGRGTRTYGAQTLFSDFYANQCGSWCNGMLVWTGYNPPIPPLKPGLKEYEADVKRENPSVDTRNQFLEGAYLGTLVFVDAVERCSPNLTRACIRQTLDAMDFASDLASTLSWRSGQHHANKGAQAFKIEATGGSFNGWQPQNTGFIRDPGL